MALDNNNHFNAMLMLAQMQLQTTPASPRAWHRSTAS